MKHMFTLPIPRIFLVRLLLPLAIVTSPLVAQDADLIVLDLYELTKPSQTGSYGNVFNALTQAKLISNWQVTPVRRAHRMFFEKKVACIAPASAELLLEYNKDQSDFVISKAFSKAYGFLFTAENPSTLKGEKPILGTIGLGDQYGIDDDLYRVTNIKSYKKLLTLINNNRIDAAYITYPDIASYPDAMAEIEAFKGTKERVWVGEDAIICHRDHSKKIGAINAKFQQWHQGDHLKKLLGVYFFEE